MTFKRAESIWLRLLTVFCAVAFASVASAGQVLTNGSFESGNFTGWAVTNSTADGSSWFVTNQANTPLNGFPTVGRSDGTYYAVTDSFGPGAHALTQTFTVPSGTIAAVLSFDVFVNDVFALGGLPQFGQVDLLAANADPLLGVALHVFYGPADTFQSNPGTPNPYVHFNADVIGFLTAGQTYKIRVLESDSNPLNVGVDNFSLVAAVPEPGMFLPAALVMGIFVYGGRRKVRLSSR